MPNQYGWKQIDIERIQRLQALLPCCEVSCGLRKAQLRFQKLNDLNALLVLVQADEEFGSLGYLDGGWYFCYWQDGPAVRPQLNVPPEDLSKLLWVLRPENTATATHKSTDTATHVDEP